MKAHGTAKAPSWSVVPRLLKVPSSKLCLLIGVEVECKVSVVCKPSAVTKLPGSCLLYLI